ncbi:DUF4062 domain-containing protein [Marinoscillum furvescens]|uniref:Uncharacterized protein DUF4062 n=1 Tax=Marinoscillum furvescens DSM 4134 TaxID=1122208 RepID=A0A3D9L6Y9_MARFU|nr:DUF4062 domain-containing protein [Marinoscillum furvescens]REE02121.1 uncharacterized protein DUF4062 [Marinoscillum furvescens DSM 4134]
MEFKKEILLCFSEEDNQPIEGGLKGWVSNFHKFLSTLLFQISKDSPEVILVSESNYEQFSLEDAAAVILVCTPQLMKNQALIDKIDQQTKELKRNNQLVVKGVPRVFKVHKAPFIEDAYLPSLEDVISYDFYMIDPLSGEAQEFKRFFGSDAERSYWMKLVDMAYDINEILSETVSTTHEEKEDAIPREKTVYLASTGVDMVIQRDIIKRELIRHGYKVLPQHTLAKDVTQLEQMIKDDLHKCRLSIHLIGEDYGYKPKGSDLSVVDIQNRIASDHTYEMVEYNKGAEEPKPFSRLIWVSPDLKNVTERQKIFIEDLKSDAAALEEAEVLQITLQELKSIIREELVTGGRFQKVKRDIEGYDQLDDAGNKVIYLIQDKSDLKQTDPLKRFLENAGFKVVQPSYEGDLVDIRYVHQENLRRCDASIIYFGNAKEAWIKTKLQDLLKAPGFGRQKKMQAKAVYFDGQKDVDLNHYKKNNALVLGNNGGFKPEHLKPFLTKLEN